MVSTTTVEEVYRQTSMGAQADGETLMAEALKSLVLDESQRPKEQVWTHTQTQTEHLPLERRP
jgi:hypothetical protein